MYVLSRKKNYLQPYVQRKLILPSTCNKNAEKKSEPPNGKLNHQLCFLHTCIADILKSPLLATPTNLNVFELCYFTAYKTRDRSGKKKTCLPEWQHWTL